MMHYHMEDHPPLWESLLFPLAFALWAAMPVYAEPGLTAELSSVRARASKDRFAMRSRSPETTSPEPVCRKTPKMAAYWYEKAAGHGNPQAQNQIGYFYQAGIGVARDPKRAVPLVSTRCRRRIRHGQGQSGDRVFARAWCPARTTTRRAIANAGLPGRATAPPPPISGTSTTSESP